MANFKKRAFPLFMALVMIFTMLPMDAMAFGGHGHGHGGGPQPTVPPVVPTEPTTPPATGETTETPATEPEAPVYVVGGVYEFDSAPAVELLPQCTAWQYVGLSDKLITEHGEHTHDESCDAVCEAEGCVGGLLDCPDCDGGKKTVDCDKCDGGKVTTTVDCKGNNGPSHENSTDHCNNGYIFVNGGNPDCLKYGCGKCKGTGSIVETYEVRGYYNNNGEFKECEHWRKCDCEKYTFENTVTCDWCNGSKICHGSENSCWKKCNKCGGVGTKTVTSNCTAEGCVNGFITVDCSCGDGVTDIYCTACGGTGKVIACGEEEHSHTDECYKLKYTIVVSHTKVVTDEAVAPTCEGTGLTEGSHCDACGAVLVARTVVDALGHSYDNGVVTTAPTCENAGVKTFTCGTCGDTYTEAVDATGHTEETVAAVAPTCEGTGLTEGVQCSVCDAWIVEQETVDALGHEWGTPVFTWAENGYTCTAIVTCERGCEKELTVTVSDEITTEATCAVDGSKTYTATTEFDGKTYTSTKEENLGKNMEIHDEENCECFRTVTFKVENGKTGKTDVYGPFEVKYGEAAKAPKISVPAGYSLGEWSADFSSVTEDMEVTASITRNFGDYDVALYVGYGKNGSTAGWTRAGTGKIKNAYDPLSYSKGYMDLPEGASFEGTPSDVAITKDGVTYTVGGRDFYTLGSGNLVVGESDGYHMDYQASFFHTVDFVIGEETVSVTVPHGGNATAPAVTAPEGFKFVKWNGSYENVTKSTTVTAVFTERTDLSYTVKEVVDGVESVRETVGGQKFGTIVTVFADAKTGYNVDAGEKSVTITTGENVVTFTYTKRSDLSYTVSYVDGEGNAVAAPKTIGAQTFGAVVTETAVQIPGYTVDQAEKSVTIATEGNAIVFKYTKRADLSYTVNYVDIDNNALAESKTVTDQTFKATVTETAKAIEGYTVDAETKSIVIDVENNVITFVYTINTYTVSWDEDGDGEAESTTTVTYGEEIALPETEPTKEGHTFNGWVDVPVTMPAGDVTIEASWTVNQYTITFDTNGGSSVAPITQDYGTEIVAPANPTLYGYVFTGWDVEIPATMPAENLTISAEWSFDLANALPAGGSQGGEDFEIIEDEEVPLADGSLLNTYEYIAYIAGFEDATVRPEKLITRAEFATIMFRLLNDDFRLENWGTESRFTDVEEDDWFFVEVTTCDNIGLLDHYEGEEFLPNEPITREEVVYIIAMFIEDAYEGEEALFTDIDDSFAFDAINDCKTVGIIGGDGDGKFRPQDTIKRAEVAKMVNLLLGRDAEELVGDLRNWTDNAEGKWYYDFIRVASNSFDAETLEVIEVDADYWKNKKEEWAAAFAALIPEDESEDEEEIED